MSFDGRKFGGLDHHHAPRTGLTRKHWEDFADHLLFGSAVSVSERLWGYRFAGRPSANGAESDELEGFARLALLAGFRLSPLSTAPVGEWYPRILEGFERAGLALKDKRPDAWPSLSRVAQPIVEASSISLALSVAPGLLWEPLSRRAQEGILGWLTEGVGHDLRWNNWAFFDTSIATFLERAGRGNATDARKRLLRRIENWYLGGGWYSDGQGTRIDYYNAWSFHFYLPLLAHLAPDELLAARAERIHPFLDSYDTLIDSEGAPVYFGRSLSYRIAAVAPFFTARLVRGSTRSAALDRSIASGVLRRFAEAGAVTDGRLSMGWWGEQPELAQSYSGGGSPLWAAKGFVGLMFDADDSLWSEPEPDVAPISQKTASIARNVAVVRRQRDGIATLHTVSLAAWPSWAPEALNLDPQYSRIAYSSVTAPEVRGKTPENTVLFERPTGPPGYRGAVDWSATGRDWSATSAPVWNEKRAAWWMTFRRARLLRVTRRLWQPRQWRSARVGVLSLCHEGCEVRLVAFTGIPAGTIASVGGYAVAGNLVEQAVVPVLGEVETRNWSTRDETNPFGSSVAVPGVTAALDANPCVVGIAITLAREVVDVAPPSVHRHHDGRITVTYADGHCYSVTVHGTRMAVARA